MKKLIVACCIMLLCVVGSNAGIFGSLFTKSDTKIENQNKKTHVELSAIKKAVANLKIDADVNATAQIGVGNKSTEVTKKMRDSIKKLSLAINKTDNSIKEVNKTITKTNTNIKEVSKTVTQSNQAGIFYVGFICFGILSIGLMFLLYHFIQEDRNDKKMISELTKQVLRERSYVDKYEKELDTKRVEGKIT